MPDLRHLGFDRQCQVQKSAEHFKKVLSPPPSPRESEVLEWKRATCSHCLQAVRRIPLSSQGRKYIEANFEQVKAPSSLRRDVIDRGQGHIYYDTKSLSLDRQDASLCEQAGSFELQAFLDVRLDDPWLSSVAIPHSSSSSTARAPSSIKRRLSDEKEILHELGIEDIPDVMEEFRERLSENPRLSDRTGRNPVLNKSVSNLSISASRTSVSFAGLFHRSVSGSSIGDLSAVERAPSTSSQASSRSKRGSVHQKLRTSMSSIGFAVPHRIGGGSGTNLAPIKSRLRTSMSAGSLFSSSSGSSNSHRSSNTAHTGLVGPVQRRAVKVPFRKKLFAGGVRPVAELCIAKTCFMAEMPPSPGHTNGNGVQQILLVVEDVEFNTARAEPAHVAALIADTDKEAVRQDILCVSFAELSLVMPTALDCTNAERLSSMASARQQVAQFLHQHTLDVEGGGSSPGGSMVMEYLRACSPVKFGKLVESGCFMEEAELSNEELLLEPLRPFFQDEDGEDTSSKDDDEIYRI